MGKTYRNIWAGSNSVDYHSPHNRGFAKEKKQYSHKQIRNSNKVLDEDSFKTMKYIKRQKKMNEHFASGYYGRIGNIPNKPWFQFTDEYLERTYWINWEKDEKSPLDTINKALDKGHQDTVFQMCKKQIERRGKMGLFYGHR